MRKKLRTLPIGSISTGTHRTQDLMGAYLDALDDIKLTRDERRLVTIISDHYHKEIFDEGDLDELVLILEDHAPTYCYFGAHEGDGADFGVWLNHDQIDTDVADDYLGRGPDLPRASTTRQSHFLQVNDHGNMTLWRKTGTRWHEEWSVV